MHARLPAFGIIEVEGRRFEHDVVIDRGEVRKRRKGPSKASRAEFGHTPLTAAEAIPWGGTRLIVGTGHDGQLPVTPDMHEEARRRRVRLIVLPTAEACELLEGIKAKDVRAILHVTC
jgi:hypothetical protein